MARTVLHSLSLSVLASLPGNVPADQCAGGQLVSNEAFQYGRFETRMQSVDGDGVVSSFFLYNIDVGCNWPDENNELDIEMTGNRDGSVQFTTHYPGPTGVTHIEPVAFDPHQGMHDYAFEWEPGVVRWFVDGELAHVQDQPFVSGLVYPMRLLMNLWGVNSPDWAGNFDASVIPATARYDYVRYYAWTPGSGDAGTGDNFTLQWSDEFDAPLDGQRWQAGDFDGFGGNLCSFHSSNVVTVDGELRLHITSPLAITYSDVHFSVDAAAIDPGPGDVVYLNGTFNNWCGDCTPMTDTDGDGTWETTLELPAGKHEYLFTTNGWNGEIGGPQQGSSCDFQPCDQYTNYGFTLPLGSSPLTTETWCWASCDSCLDSDGDGITDVDEMNYDGDPAYDPESDTDPYSADTDGDSLGDAIDPIPLDYNYADGDLAPPGNTDGELNAGDLLICSQIVTGARSPTNTNLAHGDIYPPGAPDGLIGLPDYLLLLQMMFDDDAE